MLKIKWLSAICCILMVNNLCAHELKQIKIATGSITGVYNHVGESICRIVNKERNNHKIRCSSLSTLGSVFNINALKSGEIEFAIIQSDLEFFNRTTGKGGQKIYPLLSIYDEPFTVVVKKDAKIASIDDLLGKRVSIGPVGSGSRRTFKFLMKEFNWSEKDFKALSDYKYGTEAKALCAGKVDALTFMVGNPSPILAQINQECPIKFVPVTGKKIDDLVAKYEFYKNTTIKGDVYQPVLNTVSTFGVRANLVTNGNVSQDEVDAVTYSLTKNLGLFRRMHPVLKELQLEDMNIKKTDN